MNVAGGKVVAYIDLLAFSQRVRENTADALKAMECYSTILGITASDDEQHPPSSYSGGLREVAKNNSLDSVEYMLPFSDSIFLMGTDCGDFIRQLGSFVKKCFAFTSHFYETPEDSSCPEKITFTNFSKGENGIEKTKECHKEYPTLFRGGLSYGEAYPCDVPSKENGEKRRQKILVGKAVVEAVSLEQKVKGPRLIFGQLLYDNLDDDTKNCYCRSLPEGKNLYEILWPALSYIKANGYEREWSNFWEIFHPAVNLWLAYNHTPYSSHYFNFVELIVASTIHFYGATWGQKEWVRERIASDDYYRRHLKGKLPHLIN